MPARDCAFLLAYLGGFVGFIVFMLSFVKPEWTEYKDGYAGLWAECQVNDSKPVEYRVECENSAKADGPVFLELVRTYLILALVLELMGVFGYNFLQIKPENSKVTKVLKERSQEIFYFLAGAFTIGGCTLYAINYHEYYTETRDYVQVQFRWGFYLIAVAGGMTICSSIVMFFTKYTERQKKKQDQALQAKKVADGKKSKDENKNKSPQPPSAKEKEKEKENKKEQDEDFNDQVAVKTSALKSIVAPTNVFLAFNRMKDGLGKKKKNEGDVPDIPPPSETRLFTPSSKTRELDERSISSSSSSDNDDGTHKVQRQKVRRSVTTLKDSSNSKPWAVTAFHEEDESAKKSNKPRRHMSYNAIGQPQPQTTPQHPPNRLPPIPDMGPIYILPTDSGNSGNSGIMPPPRYEEVIGTQDYGGAPQPAITEQSKIFQPYTKN